MVLEVGQVISNALKDSRFISFQDPNHSSLGVVHGMAHLIPHLAQNGVKHLFVETSPKHQSLYDKAFRGEIDREGIVEYHIKNPGNMWVSAPERIRQNAEAKADLIMTAKSHGIKVWASDPGFTIGQSLSMMFSHYSALNYLKNNAGKIAESANLDTCKPGDTVPDEIPPGMSEAMIKEMATKMLPRLMWAREEVNGRAIALAKAKIGPQDKAAFFWGKGHSENTIGARNIDEMLAELEGKKTGVTNIAIYTSLAARACLDYLKKGEPSGRDTHFFYYTAEQEMHPNQDHSEDPAFKDIAAYKAHAEQRYEQGRAQRQR